MVTPNFAIWASKNVGEGFTLSVISSPSYKLFKSISSNLQNILDFERVVGRKWKPYEGTYLCYFDKGDIKTGTVLGSITDENVIIWFRNVESKIIDPETLK